MSETVRVLLSEEEVDKRIAEIAAKSQRGLPGEQVHLICVLKGGIFLPVNLQNG